AVLHSAPAAWETVTLRLGVLWIRVGRYDGVSDYPQPPFRGRAARPSFGRDCPHERTFPAATHPDGAARRRAVGGRGRVVASLVATGARPAAVAGPGGPVAARPGGAVAVAGGLPAQAGGL